MSNIASLARHSGERSGRGIRGLRENPHSLPDPSLRLETLMPAEWESKEAGPGAPSNLARTCPERLERGLGHRFWDIVSLSCCGYWTPVRRNQAWWLTN